MYLLGDIGGTKTRLIFCQSIKDLEKRNLKIFATPQNYKEFLNLLTNFTKEHSQFLKKTRKVVLGFAGMFDNKKEKLIYAPNLKDFENRNLKKDLEKILNAEVILENDAVLAGIGEAKFGAGKSFDVFGYITLSTGVGGAKIVGSQQFVTNINTFGFEPGHSFLLINDFLFEVEELLGGENIKKVFGQRPEEIKSKKFWDQYQKILAIFLINVSIFWSVDKIILGGSLVKKLSLKMIKLYIDKFQPFPLKIQLRKSFLGDLAGIYGSLIKLKDK